MGLYFEGDTGSDNGILERVIEDHIFWKNTLKFIHMFLWGEKMSEFFKSRIFFSSISWSCANIFNSFIVRASVLVCSKEQEHQELSNNASKSCTCAFLTEVLYERADAELKG